MNIENDRVFEDQELIDSEEEHFDSGTNSGVWKETIQAYNRYQSGEITKEEYCLKIVMLLKEYFIVKARKTRRSISGSYYVDEEDLIQDFYVIVLEKIEKYDPNIAPPMGFFIGSINNKAVQVLGPEVKQHFKNNLIRLTKVARNNGFEGGLSDPELTPDILAILAGESLKVCKDAMELNRQRAVSLEEICENGFTPSIGESPESAYIKKEKTELLREQIKKLNPLEVFICEHFIMADDKKRKCLKNDYTKGSKDSINEDDCKWSLKRFADYFGVPEHFKKYADYLPKNGKVDANFLKRTINHVTMLLRCDKKLKSCGGINDAGREIIDQASFDDIESAVLGGLLMEDTIPV